MMNETMALENFRKIVINAHEKGETGLLIWKNPEEREKWGENEKEMRVIDTFDGVYVYANGTYKNIKLTDAIQDAFAHKYQFKLATMDGKGFATMAFQIDKLLSIEGHLMFACRGMLYGHMNGPIVSIPSYHVVE